MQFPLLHIPDRVCPHCGAAWRRWEQGDQHCNGEYNERLVFRCGGEIRYSPNFGRTIDDKTCPKYIRRIAEEKRAESAATLAGMNWDLVDAEKIARIMKILGEG